MLVELQDYLHRVLNVVEQHVAVEPGLGNVLTK